MRVQWVAFVVVAALCVAMDIFICRRLSRSGHRWAALLNASLAVVTSLAVMAMGVMPLTSATTPNGQFVLAQYALYACFAIWVPKAVGLALYGLGRPLGRRWMTTLAFATAAVTLAVMCWSAVVTPGKVEVRQVTLELERLPDEFDGYRIAHWSDAHLGTYNGRTSIVERWVDTINALRPNMICFTGDLVSRLTDEALPYRDILSRLTAPDGVYSVLGNHDYADYVRWSDDSARVADCQALCDLQSAMGWQLLNDDHVMIARGGSKIAIIGTENYGDRPGETQGRLDHAYDALNDSVFKILLQHNPVAWRASVLPCSNIDLTLSGHTHAFQLMLKLGPWRWSPAAWRYREWGGLYSEDGRCLYVNTGAGMTGPPMRIGATPEITLITLKKKR